MLQLGQNILTLINMQVFIIQYLGGDCFGWLVVFVLFFNSNSADFITQTLDVILFTMSILAGTDKQGS